MHVLSRASSITGFLVAIAVVLAACGGEGGEALPSNGTTPPNTDASSQAPSNPLEAVNACDLMTDDEAVTISAGLDAEDKGSSGAHSVCEWSTSVDRGVPIEEAVVFDIATRPTQNVDNLRALDGGKVTLGNVGDRKAKQVAEDGRIEGTCVLGISVGSGRVDIGVKARRTDRACQVASDVSTIIEPKLPQG